MSINVSDKTMEIELNTDHPDRSFQSNITKSIDCLNNTNDKYAATDMMKINDQTDKTQDFNCNTTTSLVNNI